MKARSISAKILKDVLADNQMWEPSTVDYHEHASTIKHYCFSVLRHYYFLHHLLDGLLKKPLKEKDFDIKSILLIGLLEIWQDSNKSHAVVNESVNACLELKKTWAKGMINATLRTFLREKEQRLATTLPEEAQHNHPKWFIKKLKQQWPDHWTHIIKANQERAPMVLRINAQKTNIEKYIKALADTTLHATKLDGCEQAIILEAPVDVQKLPNFEDGHVSVQDLSAQCAARLLDVQAGMRVLDACAAPGGKTAHVLETTPDIKMHAIEINPKRSQRLQASLKRLGLSATVITADAALTHDWWDKKPYDRILIDAPCTGSGVIRRHPDIKLRLYQEAILQAQEEQAELLEALWPLLAPGGILLYATCSIFKEENVLQIETFIQETPDAKIIPCELNLGIKQNIGQQILPAHTTDGFYYAKLTKMSQ